jgi:hypothetical protein
MHTFLVLLLMTVGMMATRISKSVSQGAAMTETVWRAAALVHKTNFEALLYPSVAMETDEYQGKQLPGGVSRTVKHKKLIKAKQVHSDTTRMPLSDLQGPSLTLASLPYTLHSTRRTTAQCSTSCTAITRIVPRS